MSGTVGNQTKKIDVEENTVRSFMNFQAGRKVISTVLQGYAHAL